MNPAHWIAIGATLLVILAHVALFWFFLGKPRDNRDPDHADDPDS